MTDWLAIALDFYICVILTVEYFWGRSDMDIKNEAKKRAKMIKARFQFEHLTAGEGRECWRNYEDF